jgi:excinuclease ABC subunit A
MADVEKLLHVLHRLVDAGNTVVVIEHNLDVVKTADWIVDLGPEGGERGGFVIGEGTPEDIAAVPGSATGEYLARVLRGEPLVPLSAVTFTDADGVALHRSSVPAAADVPILPVPEKRAAALGAHSATE